MTTIRQTQQESKVCQQLDLGLLQEVLPATMIEELLETYQMWEGHERKLNMLVLTYWLIALHLYPQLSMRRVYSKLVSGQRAWRDDVPQQIPVKTAFSFRRERLGSELLEELFAQCAGPKATEQTPGAFWRGLRLLAIDGTVESVPDTPSNREAFRYSIDDERAIVLFPEPARCCWWNVGLYWLLNKSVLKNKKPTTFFALARLQLSEDSRVQF